MERILYLCADAFPQKPDPFFPYRKTEDLLCRFGVQGQLEGVFFRLLLFPAGFYPVGLEIDDGQTFLFKQQQVDGAVQQDLLSYRAGLQQPVGFQQDAELIFPQNL